MLRANPRRTGGRRALLLILVAVILNGCGREGPPAAGARRETDRSSLRIVFVTHGQSADPFWSVVANGARAAGRDLGVRVEYQAPTTFDMVRMSQLIDAVAASRPAGLVVSIPDSAALAAAIRGAVAAGIPVISINSGAAAYRALGVLTHVGQSEYEAGRGAGERMGAAGVHHALCVNHEVGNSALDTRCRGFADGLAERGGAMRVLAVDLADPEDTQRRVGAALAADTTIDGILTLGPAAATPTLAALREAGRLGRLAYATFDLTPEVLAAVLDHQMLFAVDQQQYLQGYLPVVFLVNYLETGTMPGGGGVIRTGPAFVTAETAQQVMGLAARGLR